MEAPVQYALASLGSCQAITYRIWAAQLGRPLRGRDYGDDTTVKVPGEIDVQRARRILEELRKRFGESFRPQLELDYIERLLKDY